MLSLHLTGLLCPEIPGFLLCCTRETRRSNFRSAERQARYVGKGKGENPERNARGEVATRLGGSVGLQAGYPRGAVAWATPGPSALARERRQKKENQNGSKRKGQERSLALGTLENFFQPKPGFRREAGGWPRSPDWGNSRGLPDRLHPIPLSAQRSSARNPATGGPPAGACLAESAEKRQG